MRSQIGRIKTTQSRSLDGFSYNAETGTLTVMFLSGSAYCYRDVPVQIALGFAHAESAGAFFSGHIRNVYEVERIL
jgi:hypothetical protein